MKKLYTALLLPFCFAAQAQIRPGGNFTPDTTVTFSIAQTKLNVGSAGQNQNWDFSKVTFIDTAISRTFIPNTSTLGYSLFPKANLASTAIRLLPNGVLEEDSVFGFVYHVSSFADFLGYYYEDGGNNYEVKYNPPLRISITPFIFNDEFNYKVDAKVTSNEKNETAPYQVQKGSGKWKYDATGMALFPNETNPVFASRYKNTEELFDTIISLTDEYESKSYIYANNITYFVLDQKTNKSIGIGYGKYTVTNILKMPGSNPTVNTETHYDTTVVYERSTSLKEIKLLATGIDEQQEVLNVLTAYPVPSNGMVSLNSNEIEFVEITDAKGVFVDRQKYNGSISLPAQSGLYFIKAILPDGRYKNLKVAKE